MTADPRLARLSNHTAAPPPPPPPPPAPESRPNPNYGLDGPSDSDDGPQPTQDSYKLKFCTVCASNQNRSMEAHMRLATAAYPVISFGTGSLVRLPGPSINQPNVFTFNNTSYEHMLDELMSKDPRLYRNNGVLNMVERNKNLKWGPERFQDWVPGLPRLEHLAKEEKGSKGTEGGVVDVIFTCEERCWDAVVDDLLNRGGPLNRPVHVFNVDIRDNHEEASVGGKAILELADSLNRSAAEEIEARGSVGWENGAGAARKAFDEKVPDILAEWQERWPSLPSLWTVAWL
jgi:RNA polymerase II subunit A C-terminal domain phosphatase SSU72